MYKHIINVLNSVHKGKNKHVFLEEVTQRLSQKHESTRQHFKRSQEDTKHHDEGNLDSSSIHNELIDTKPTGVVLETHTPDHGGA